MGLLVPGIWNPGMGSNPTTSSQSSPPAGIFRSCHCSSQFKQPKGVQPVSSCPKITVWSLSIYLLPEAKAVENISKDYINIILTRREDPTKLNITTIKISFDIIPKIPSFEHYEKIPPFFSFGEKFSKGGHELKNREEDVLRKNNTASIFSLATERPFAFHYLCLSRRLFLSLSFSILQFLLALSV